MSRTIAAAVGRPGHRTAGALCAAGLLSLVWTAPSAHAATDEDGARPGQSDAAVLRTDLEVSLLKGTAQVPLRTALNEVHAPTRAEKTALSVRLDGVADGQPVNIVRADVASAEATADRRTATGSARLAHATVRLPGLGTPLLQADQVASTAVCPASGRPTATSKLPGSVSVLGERVTLSGAGGTDVRVPGVGDVHLELSETSTTSHTAAATALEAKVAVNPLKLNVAKIEGHLTLAEASCRAPGGEATDPEPTPGGERTPTTEPTASAEPAGDPRPQTTDAPAEQHLAETGQSGATRYLVAGAAALAAVGAGVLIAVRRRTAAHGQRG